MFWRISFVAVFCAIVTPAIAAPSPFVKCMDAQLDRYRSETTRPTPTEFERIIRGACRSEELELAKAERFPYMEPIKGMDMTESNQHVDKFNKEGDERRAKFAKDIRDTEISEYTKFYYSHPQ